MKANSFALVALLGAHVGGCTGEIGSPAIRSGLPPGGAGGGETSQAPLCERAPSLPKRVTMLSATYYAHALEDIFPAEVLAQAAPLLGALSNTQAKAPFRTMTVGGGLTTVITAFDLAWNTAFTVLDDAAIDRLDPCLGSYVSASAAAQAACIDRVLERYTRLILRATPSAAELARSRSEFMSAAAGADHREGLRFTLAYLLQRPEFLYHLELGLAAGGPLTNDEVLSRLSRTLWDSPPSDALRAQVEGLDLSVAATRGQLARNMLADPRASRQLSTFYTQLLKLDDAVTVTSNPEILNGVSAVALRADAQAESEAFVRQTFERGGSLADLLTSSQAIVPSANLARVYGVDASTVGQLSTVPDRGGLLSRAAILINAGDVPNVFHFGSLVARNVLCDSIPPPDPGLLQEADKITIPSDATGRERAELLTSSGVCLSCHSRFNGYGFARTGFSTIGQRISAEKIFDATGNVVRVAPVNTAGEISVDGQKIAVKNLTEAAEVMGRSYDANRCLVVKFASFTEGRAPGPADECLANHLGKEGGSLQDTLVRLVTAPEFVTRGDDPP